jgi:hypothetical protein
MSTDPENEAPRRSGRGAENESKPCKTHNAMKKFYTKNPQKQEDDSYESNQNIHIPEDFPLDCLGAAKQYLELGLVPIPLNRFDEGTEKERGKKPKIRGYRQLTNSGINTSYPGNHWGGTRPANVGLTLCGDHIVIDVDSKADGGASARKFVEEHPILSSFPREITPGGVHIHLLCPDLPRHDDTGKKRKSPLVCQWNEDLTFELMSDGMPITVAPSMHKTGTRYRWEKTGKLLVLLWAEVQRIFGFEDPSETDGTHCKGRPWWREWEEDLRTLRLTDLLRDLGLLGQCLASRDGKWAVRCPWESEHSGDPAHEPGSDTVIFHKPDELPAFKCLHSHCAKRRIEDFLKALERKHPGKITKYCDQVADASRASKPSTRRPRILLPVGGRSASEFAKEVGETIGPTNELFVRGNDIVELVPSDSGMAIASEFDVLSPKSLVTAVERSAEIGRVKSDDEGAPTFVTQSMSEAQARVLSSSRQFRQELPRIERILPIRIPHLESGSLCYPELGYNSISLTWVSTDAPSIGGMSLAEAKETLLNEVLAGPDQGGFFWRDAQAQTHALARVLTSYCRGLMNWARTPVFIFAGNREGCGKDTCAAIASTLITGSAAIGAPLSKHSDDEMRKRITATHRAGRQSLHFANLKGDIDFASLEAATDGSGFWEDRVLGSSMIVRLRNEAEYSLSANHATWSPDLERRCRQVQLHLAAENVNAVSYRFPDLLRHVQNNRTRYLAALDAFVRQWVDEGCPEGPTRFTSFPEWGRVVGGILYACGLGDPCLPHPETETCGDQETIAMRSLFRWAFERYGDKAMDKQTVVAAVRGNTGMREFFDWIEFEEKSGAIRFGKLLAKFDNRELGGILFRIDRTSKNAASYRFRKVGPDDNPGDGGCAGSVSPSGGEIQRTTTQPTKPSDYDGNSETRHGTSPTSLRSPTPGADRVSAEEALRGIGDALSCNRPISLFLRSECSKTGEATDPREGDQHNLVIHQEGVGIFDLDLTALNYNLQPIHQILCESLLYVVNGKDLLGFLSDKCGIIPSRICCLETAHRLLQAGIEHDHSLYGILAGLNKGAPDSRSKLEEAPGYLDLFSLHRRAENLVESAGIRAVWELENELLPVVVQFEEAGMPVHAPSMLRIRGKHKDEALRLLEHVEADGRIRAKFNPLGTRTGRFSCEKPNLQGVSRGIVREALRPAAGNLFLNADYSQIELRVAAEIASSVTLIKAFQSGVDIHEATASRVLGKTFESLSKEERQLGKGLNFGLLYGQSASGFRSTVKKRFGLEISAQEASVYRNVFFQTYPELRAWHNLVRKDAQAGLSEARTLIGRRRLLPKELPFRKRFSTLLNTPVQGTMADGMKRALCLLDRELPQGAKIVSVIHDEVILEVPSSLATEELLNLVRQCLVDGMRSVLPTVPIEVDPHFSESWN